MRALTGPWMLVVGTMFLFLWRRLGAQIHPVDRAARLGPFVTELGLRAVLDMRQTFLAFGLFLATQGLSSVTFWSVAGKDYRNGFVAALGSLASAFALWSAFLAAATMVRVWRNR